MIQTRTDLSEYLMADRLAQPSKYPKPLRPLIDRTYKIKTFLRRCEYHYNNRSNIFHKTLYFYNKLRYTKLLRSCCSEIGLNVFGKGLIIWHPERIIVNSNSVVGNNCSISSGVVIAQAHDRCPRIGDNVEIMINGTVLGGISVASNTRIGANALVIKDILEANTTWAGVPAKKISKNKVQA